ncbi:MAG: phosphoadenylyl-sulfate reductase [Acidobacteria bacterium]|nr:phosphoadenylyl-sulfate reductase [Acidobacteriota bacterium]
MDIPYLNEWNQHLKSKSPEEILQFAIEQFDSIVFSSSLGPEDQVITDVIAQHHYPIRIITLDTGRLFEETQNLLTKTREHYRLNIESVFPLAIELEPLVNAYGPNLFYQSQTLRQACCKVRKVLPLKRVLATHNAWITGLRRDQTANRLETMPIEWDPGFNIIKINPLWNWSEGAVWDYLESHNAPVNTLHSDGYPSIGCAPCTRAVKPGQDPRSGRWWWETGNQECGLHVVEGKIIRAAAIPV